MYESSRFQTEFGNIKFEKIRIKIEFHQVNCLINDDFSESLFTTH